MHNFSNHYLTTNHFNILSKGLSFAPYHPFTQKDHTTIVHQFDSFSDFLRNIIISQSRNTPMPTSSEIDTETAFLYRQMKFLKGQPKKSQYPITLTNIPVLENFIVSTRIQLENHNPIEPKRTNLSKDDLKTIKELTNPCLTIKPADKNLGVAILNSTDYIDQCLEHLCSKTYTRTETFPADDIIKLIGDVLIKFKDHLTPYKKLYQFLQPHQQHQIPNFYGLPKVHKPLNNNGIPPIRPIIAHTNSLLSHTAQFINHVLQPLAQQYEDYIKNSTDLIIQLEEFTITEEIVLVTLDVTNLYPSIPQQECINIIHEEMFKHTDLIIFDPNLISHLLQVNINNNYFNFAETTFIQQQGTAMGASFSPTIANIFMSILLKNFLRTISEKPIFLKRYIDDIIVLWPKRQNLNNFLFQLNNFHGDINFTSTSSNTSIDFLDITIYKDGNFEHTGKLSISTFQKTDNLYQYLHFSSYHPATVFKGIIKGEAIRYIRTNSSKKMYLKQVNKFIERLVRREYPLNFIKKSLRKVDYRKRREYIDKYSKPTTQPSIRPIFKCIYTLNYHQIKEIIMNNFNTRNLLRFTDTPLFVLLRNRTIRDLLVKSKYKPIEEDLWKITKHSATEKRQNIIIPKNTQVKTPSSCKNPRCATCSHFLEGTSFKSTNTKQVFRIRHPFTCTSFKIIYLITCSICSKQYVGATMRTLKNRMNQHRSSIKRKQDRYISKHFNLPNHTVNNLRVQVIDTANNIEDLQKKEQFWIKTLNTIQPIGLNVECIM